MLILHRIHWRHALHHHARRHSRWHPLPCHSRWIRVEPGRHRASILLIGHFIYLLRWRSSIVLVLLERRMPLHIRLFSAKEPSSLSHGFKLLLGLCGSKMACNLRFGLALAIILLPHGRASLIMKRIKSLRLNILIPWLRWKALTLSLSQLSGVSFRSLKVLNWSLLVWLLLDLLCSRHG